MDAMLKDLQKVSSELSKSRAAMEAALQESTPPGTAAAHSSLSMSEMLPGACASGQLSHQQACSWPHAWWNTAKPAT